MTDCVPTRAQMLWMELVLTRGELPIALYRCCEVRTGLCVCVAPARSHTVAVSDPQAKNSPLPYVIANPRPSTRLHAGDRVFVLCGESLLAEAARAAAAAAANPALARKPGIQVPRARP